MLSLNFPRKCESENTSNSQCGETNDHIMTEGHGKMNSSNNVFQTQDFDCGHKKKQRIKNTTIDEDMAMEKNEHKSGFECPWCCIEFGSWDDAMHHGITEHHQFHCAGCCISFGSRQQFQTHLTLTKSITTPFVCAYCCKSFTSAVFMKLHEQNHCLPWYCSHCGSRFKTSKCAHTHLYNCVGSIKILVDELKTPLDETDDDDDNDKVNIFPCSNIVVYLNKIDPHLKLSDTNCFSTIPMSSSLKIHRKRIMNDCHG